MIELQWKDRVLVADFTIPGDEMQALRVRFDAAEIVRILDEMPLSTELETTPNEGLIPNHFAYSVEGALFWQSQSEALKLVRPSLRHYRFITGSTCIDVLSDQAPTFLLVASQPKPKSSG